MDNVIVHWPNPAVSRMVFGHEKVAAVQAEQNPRLGHWEQSFHVFLKIVIKN